MTDTVRVVLPWKLHFADDEGELIPYGPGEADVPRAMAEGLVRENILDEVVLEEISPRDTIAGTRAVRRHADRRGAPLPDDFPARDLLVDAGYEYVEAIEGMSDEDLLDVHGIGPATLEDIRTACEAYE